MSAQVQGRATVEIARPPGEVFDAIADVTRMGEWSPENTGGRWVDGAVGPAPGARFEGDNVAAAGPVTLKRWTTTSEVTECEHGRVFEFLTEGHTTWRYELVATDAGTTVTETFSHPPYAGWQRVVYGVLAQRQRAMERGMARTLAELKAVLEVERPTERG